MQQFQKVQIAVPPGADEGGAQQARALFADAIADCGLSVELAEERMKAQIQAGPFSDFAVAVAAGVTTSVPLSLAGQTKDGVKHLYESLRTRFTGRAVVVYIRVYRLDGRVITYRLPPEHEQSIKRIELIVAELDLDDPKPLTS